MEGPKFSVPTVVTPVNLSNMTTKINYQERVPLPRQAFLT